MKAHSRLFQIAVVILLALVVVGASSAAPAEERKVVVPAGELPNTIRAVLQKAFPDGRIVAVEKEVEGEDPGQYDLVIGAGDSEYEVEVSATGKIIETKERSAEDETENRAAGKQWTSAFDLEDCTFSTLGRNRFFVLVPGHQLVLESPEEKVVITVLDETRKIGAVETRVIEEREEKDGQLKEVSRNFFALCREHGDVFYFGEEVDDYEDGQIVGHGGAWRADEKDARAGLIMPGTALLGARHYQEIAPNAQDRAEIVADDVTMTTPAGTFTHCIRVEETSGLDPEEKCYKTYAPGIGLIQDEDLLLTSYKTVGDEKVAWDDLPRTVRRVIRRHAEGGQIVEVEKEIVAGTVVYEAEVVRDGRELDICVSAAGEYLGTEQDEADSPDEDKD